MKINLAKLLYKKIHFNKINIYNCIFMRKKYRKVVSLFSQGKFNKLTRYTY